MKPRTTRRRLLRVLGVWEGAAIGIGVAIGAGIFRTPGYVAGFLDQPWKIMAAWVLGALLVLGDSLILAELATRMPGAGGWYVYIEKGWGRFPAFVYGWTYMLVVDPASSAALVVVLGEFLGQLLGLTDVTGRVLGIGITLGLFALSLAGIRVGSRLQDALTYSKLAALLLVGVLALFLHAPDRPAGATVGAMGSDLRGAMSPPQSKTVVVDGSASEARQVPDGTVAIGDDNSAASPAPATPASATQESARTGSVTPGLIGELLALGLALQGVLWTFEGYSNTTTMTEESVEPRRTLPRALVLGSLALGVTYFVVNAAYLHALGREALAGSSLPAADMASRLFGSSGTTIFLFFGIFAALGSLNGAALSAPRVAYALARSGLAPEPFTRVTRLGTPDLATLWFALAWTAYAWFGSFEGLVSVSVFIGALANVAVTATIFTHRRRDRATQAATGAPGVRDARAGPLAPGRGHAREVNSDPDPAAPESSFYLSPFYPVLPLLMLALWSTFSAAVLYSLGWNVGYGLLATALAAGVYLVRMRISKNSDVWRSPHGELRS